MKKLYLFPAILPMAMLSLSVPASAADPASPNTDLAPTSPEMKSGEDSSVQKKSPMLSLEQLNSHRGGTQIAVNLQQLNSTNTGNVIGGDYAAGDVNISDNAFSNFSGLGNFVFNTGAQASLQAGLSITLNVEQ
jgi:hypothetical protein